MQQDRGTGDGGCARCADFLDGTRFTVDQVRFVNLVVDELTANGVMHPKRLFESPYTDGVRVDLLFPDSDVDVIAGVLHDVRRRALAEGA